MYLAEWSATQVAVKLLAGGQLGSSGDVQRALSQSAPLLRKLEAEASLLASLRWVDERARSPAALVCRLPDQPRMA